MAKQGSTKEKIIKLISKGDNTLSKISGKLELAPSTVSKHIHDLESTGAISQLSSEHIKKWKYYRVNQDADTSRGMVIANREEAKPILNAKIAVPAAAGTMILLLAVAIYFYGAQTTSIPISITDPPQVPQGTQALYINYSSLIVHLLYDGHQSTLAVSSSGRIDLMSIINESQVIGMASITPNSTIESIQFNITNASIVIDNVTYPVVAASRTVSATLENSGRVNSSAGILLDFSPVVVPAYPKNASASSFIMLPSVRAAVTPRPYAGQGNHMGGRFQVQQYMKAFINANVSITSSSLSVSDNQTAFSVTVENSGSGNMTVFGIVLQGQSFSNGSYHKYGYNGSYAEQNSTLTLNATSLYDLWSENGNGTNGSIRIDIRRPINSIMITGMGQFHGPGSVVPGGFQGQPGALGLFNQGDYLFSDSSLLAFSIAGNATLSPFMPYPMAHGHPFQITGFVIVPHSSQTFKYYGELMPGGTEMAGNQSTYRVIVATDHGIATANVSSR